MMNKFMLNLIISNKILLSNHYKHTTQEPEDSNLQKLNFQNFI